MFIKRDRFLGKFKKGPPHIGEYNKNDIFSEENRLWFITTLPHAVYEYEKYENTSRKNKILLLFYAFYIYISSLTS